MISLHCGSKHDPLYLVQADRIGGAVLELGRSMALVRGHLLGALERPAVSFLSVPPSPVNTRPPLGITRLSIYAGLAGFFILSDDAETGRPDNPLGLPTHPDEVPIVTQDRCFEADGSLFIPAEFERSEDVEEDANGFLLRYGRRQGRL